MHIYILIFKSEDTTLKIKAPTSISKHVFLTWICIETMFKSRRVTSTSQLNSPLKLICLPLKFK